VAMGASLGIILGRQGLARPTRGHGPEVYGAGKLRPDIWLPYDLERGDRPEE
jgi:hypothetical protein